MPSTLTMVLTAALVIAIAVAALAWLRWKAGVPFDSDRGDSS
jgi:hypothetical protein